ncbi:MAG: HAD family hydrolase, partial [Candidatus Adiutrix sp.]
NKPHPNTITVVQHFFPNIFEVVLGLRAGFAAKPDPAGAFELIKSLDLTPSQVIYVGDSDVDMKTGRKAGMLPLGAGWGYRPASELIEAGAHLVLSSPHDIAPLVKTLNS